MGHTSRSLLFSGARFQLFEIVVDGCHLVQEFVDGLSEAEQKKVGALLRRTAENGIPRSSEHFKKLDDDLFEFKAHQVRIFCAFRGKSILVLTHGIKKKKDKHDKKDMDRAKQLLKQLDEQRG
jgi:phage-related protein